MKSGVFVTLVAALSQLGTALPAPQPALVTAVVMEEVQMYVNQAGNTLETSTMYSTLGSTTSSAASTTSTAATAPSPSSSAGVVALEKSSSSSVAVAPSSTPASTPTSTYVAASSSSSAPASGSAGTGPGFSSGIAYSPYTVGGCKTAQEVATDMAALTSYDIVRIYGVDCNQVANVLTGIKGTNIKVFAGIFDVDQVTTEAQEMISQVGGNWEAINTINVGNEAVNDGTSTVAEVTAAIGTARSLLRAAGYTGPVVTVDTMVAMKNNIELCTASDFCAFNCHAFFDGSTLPQNAGSFVQGWVSQISALAPGKQWVVTESGWPTQGSTNGVAVPSQQNQQAAIASLKAAFPENLILFSAYNNPAATNSGSSFGTNQFFGILGGGGAGN